MNLILSVNAGSSSLKLSLYKYTPSSSASAENNEAQSLQPLLTASISNISTPHPSFSATHHTSSSSSNSNTDTKTEHKPQEQEIKSHHKAFEYFLSFLQQENSEEGRYKLEDITHLCHRVVHGGTYTCPTVITEETYHHIEELSDLAPLHNASALSVIQSCLTLLPKGRSIAFFDTTFHTTIPGHVYSYMIDQEVARKRGLRKYGFHGLSYSYVLHTLSHHLSRPPTSLTLIILHLGSGASICAIRNGLSIDTTMGLTPLDGLPGATRSGSVDPSLVFHYLAEGEGEVGRMSLEGVGEGRAHLTEAERILNKEAGWKSLTGTTDFGSIISKVSFDTPFSSSYIPSSSSSSPNSSNDPAPTNPETLAFRILLDRIHTYLGSYILKLGGPWNIDGIVFTGGIGERSVELRREVMRMLCGAFGEWRFDKEANESVGEREGKVVDISGKGTGEENAGPMTWVCRTDEQFEMARQLVELGEGDR